MDVREKQVAITRLQAAIRWLAGRCDWATSQDGMGFSGVDAPLGHALAEKEGVWSPREVYAATYLVVKYGKQLDGGGIDITGTTELRHELTVELTAAERRRPRRREVIRGEITVDEARSLIALQSGYNEDLKIEIKQLAGAKWNDGTKTWTCPLNAENAIGVTKIAEKFGLALRPHAGWATLAPARKVEIDGETVVVRGINVTRVLESIPPRVGDPEVDERVFHAIEPIDATTIGIQLRTWVIRSALLWLANMPADDRQLGWARGEMTRLLTEGYPAAALREKASFARAAALTLADTELAALRARLPDSIAGRVLPHQWVAVRAILDQPYIILADEQGLGKTIEILVALAAVDTWPAVVVCPPVARLNWRDEIAAWLPGRTVAVLGGKIGKRDRGAPVTEADFIIVNYEWLTDDHLPELLRLRPATLVLDEAQALKSHDSLRTQTVKRLAQGRNIARIVLATGTPVINRPSELLTLLSLLPHLLPALGGFTHFAARYCRATHYQGGLSGGWWDYGGADHLGELANRIRETGCFIRRDKASVLPDLPAKAREMVAVEIENREEYQRAVEDFQSWLRQTKDDDRPRRRQRERRKASPLRSAIACVASDEDDPEEWADEVAEGMAEDARAEALQRITYLRRLSGLGKISAAVDLIKARVKDGKLVVFAYHIEVQQALIAALTLAGHQPLSILGDQSDAARRTAIQRFQTGSDTESIVCSLRAAQTAITLTAARQAIFVELDWTPAGLEQAEDRIHRIGQRGQVTVTYLRATGTFDDRMLDIIKEKREVIGTLAAATAPFGYRPDGAPRKQAPGPGRPRLDPSIRDRGRKASRAGWRAAHPEYFRDYMRRRRLKQRVQAARQAIARLAQLESYGFHRMRADTAQYGREQWDRELAALRDQAARARTFLATLGEAGEAEEEVEEEE